MKIQNRLLVGTTLAALLIGNAIPVLGAATGTITWAEVKSGFLLLNLFLVLPAIPPASLAAWIQSHDPDFHVVPAWLNSLGIVLLAIAAYAASTALINNTVASVFARPAPLFLPTSIGLVMFQTLIVAAIAFVPAWLVETAVVRWALGSKATA